MKPFVAARAVAGPRPVTFPNIDNVPPGSPAEIFSLDPDSGTFDLVGTGIVSADGQRIETVSGGLRAADWFCVYPRRLDQDASGTKNNPDKPCPGCQLRDGASMFSLHDGHMATRFTLPAYRSLEASRALTFDYRTFRAFPRPVVAFNGSIVGALPGTVSHEFTVGGVRQGDEVYVSTQGLAARGRRFRTAASFDATDFPSGMYDYRLVVTSNYTRSCLSRIAVGEVMVANEQASPFGTGWMLGGLYRLAFNANASVTLIAPNGNSITYDPSSTDPDVFEAPDSDYATFVRNSDDTYTHTEKDGVRMRFDATGLLIAHIDRNDNTTAYAYDGAGRLVTLTDPVGLDTVFVYDSLGRLARVTDPANRTSRFEHDAAGNLIKVTFPDETFETFEYDTRHLMTAHTDERQNRYTDRYDAFGRVIDGTLPDGTVRAALGQTARGLVDVSNGNGTQANPAPPTFADQVEGSYVDGRGNDSRRELDANGRATLEVDEVGRVTLHERDADSNPTRTERPIGSVVTRTFDTLGNVLTETEEFNGAKVTYTYDAFSLVTSVTNPRVHTTTITRDPANGNPLTVVNHLGHTTTMNYDTRGLVTRMESPVGLVTTVTYNAQGLMATKTETPPPASPGNVRDWRYAYFPTGLLRQVETPDGIVLDYAYDARSFLTSVTTTSASLSSTNTTTTRTSSTPTPATATQPSRSRWTASTIPATA